MTVAASHLKHGVRSALYIIKYSPMNSSDSKNWMYQFEDGKRLVLRLSKLHRKYPTSSSASSSSDTKNLASKAVANQHNCEQNSKPKKPAALPTIEMGKKGRVS